MIVKTQQIKKNNKKKILNLLTKNQKFKNNP
jgi:hypothetical protein